MADKSDPPANPFSEEPLKDLWNQGLEANNRTGLSARRLRRVRDSCPLRRLPISISEYSIDEGCRLCWRGRIWLPLFEPLRTHVIQDTHDPPLSGYRPVWFRPCQAI
ncbi:hypothetical protein N657DRAFT_100332 [Parathielavia appendiculata]|uniref:Uncharacterized protein n=1 Tax=Parathielavia appendiculata TaxID=2587402 RepID=A0AAN6TW73_9PEZI|nr:hypothetical protein N657DRAFT_100332 [Parathielavia appendiculata]